jgi:MOSC domain-containing protein YiiM
MAMQLVLMPKKEHGLENYIDKHRQTRKKSKIGNHVVETGIYKKPSFDSMKINQHGLLADVIVDTTSHGGVDQAVYLYSLEDYAWWSAELQRDMPTGTFGENLTFSTFGNSALKIGDRFQINDVLLEVTFARIPCDKLGARMGDPGFVKRFVQAQRPGIYARVLKIGELRVGDTVRLIPTGENHPTVIELYDLWYSRERNPELLRKGLAAPIAERARAAFRFWLDGKR